MAVAQLKVLLQPSYNRTRLDTCCQLSVVREPLFLGERPEVGGAFSGFRLNVR